jgi:amidase
MIAFKSATELVAMLRDRQISPAELFTEYDARIRRFNGKLNAIVWQDPNAAANARDANVASPLAGLPMTLKESNHMKGTPTTWGVPALRNQISQEDAVVVTRLREAGANIFGKTNVPLELGDFQSYNEIYGTTNNPWNQTRGPGGSSGGAAAALAAGLTALEIGSDIGGSIRNPAHYCGVFGHKPTFRLVPVRGHAPMPALTSPDILVVGPLARSAADLDLALDIVAAPDRLESGIRYDLPRLGARRLRDLKVAVWANDVRAPVSKDCERGVVIVADALRSAGAIVNDGARPALPPGDPRDLGMNLLFAALSIAVPDAAFDEMKAQLPKLTADQPNAAMLRAQTMDHRTWLQLNEAREHLRWAWRDFFDDYDILLAPISSTAAFPHDHSPFGSRTLDVDGTVRPYFEQSFWAGFVGISYMPSTVIPTGPNAAGLPIGVQIIGPEYSDRITIGVARLLEAEGFAFTPPPGFA